MSSYSFTASLREPCEDNSCLGLPGESLRTFFCAQCDCSFCDMCWDKQPSHKPKKRGTNGAHEKTDHLVVERYRDILESSSNIQEQEGLHKNDEDTTWFGIGRNQANEPVFEDYGQFATLMAESLSEAHKSRYPQLVSFVGQTGAGKSTVVKMLINHQDMKTNSTMRARFASPVVGSVNDNVPVSADVHLYADPDTFLTESPILYADSEGLEGGESAPRAEALKLQDKVSEVISQRKSSLEPTTRKLSRKKGYGAQRNLPWATGNKEKSKREYAVTELYPRLLYTFSDVVVFVLRNTKTFESAVLAKLIRWASSSFEKSLGQPALPHIIIALNVTDLAIDASQWDVKNATQKFLSEFETSIERIPALQTLVAKWRSIGRSIKTTQDLLECYYSSITVVRIPAKGRYMLIDEQVEKLHTEIVTKSNQSHHMKRKVRMLSNSDDLQLYLQYAFDHFSQDLEAPFNFVEVALKINPIPSDFNGNIVKLAVAIRDRHPNAKVIGIFSILSDMVASCIMLDIHRHRRLGTPYQLLEDHYMVYCEQAFSDFCDRHWQCSFTNRRKERCTNVLFGHAAKGHQNKEGKVLASGNFCPSFHYPSDLCRWIQQLERNINNMQESRDKALLARPNLSSEEITSSLHLGNMNKFYTKLGSASEFMSHSTCFCCLREIPVHSLSCGHVLCTPCLRSYGISKGKGSIEILECPMGRAEEWWSESCLFNFKPPLAGVRVLCLDGGGMRGIVELEVLKVIEKELPPGIPIRSFFDLIVGTSTGGIIALGLGVEGWSVDECIRHFEDLCNTAFTPRELHSVPGLKQLAMMNHSYSRYKTKPLEEALKGTFSFANEPLFGRRHSRSSLKVAVTATTEIWSQAVLMTNYNRSHQEDDRLIDYLFERAEKPEDELNVWEAARATSAAPSFFKAFRSKRRARCYWDGAVFHNNPVQVADMERRLIWPDTANSPPDILLSIGTSCNRSAMEAASDVLHSQQQGDSPMPTTEAKRSDHESFSWRLKGTQKNKVFKMLRNRVEGVLNTETTWLKFMSDAARGTHEDKTRYRRLNPNIGENPPKLDEVKMLHKLQQQIRKVMKDPAYERQIGEVARQLVSSSFYVETSGLPINLQEPDATVTVWIKCKFPSDSPEIRYLGEYLKNVTTSHFQPYFIIEESHSTLEPQRERITMDLIQGMMMSASFEIGPVTVPVSNEFAVTTVCLSVVAREELPISGFPRALLSRHTAEALPLNRNDSQRQMKATPSRTSRLARLGDDTSSQASEASNTAFPELQKLPKGAKTLIRHFLEEKISSLHLYKEDVPVKMRLLVEAAQDTDDEADDTEPGDERGPYGSVLHAAAAAGLSWIVEMQIKAGVDVTAVDDHMWTALMVAKAQGHDTCAQLISEHMLTIGASMFPLPLLLPSCLETSESSTSVQSGSDHITLGSKNPNLPRRIQFRSDHPIPLRSGSFYFEISILNNGPLGIIGLGLCRPETDRFGMPGWHPTSWGYHGDEGKKFNSPTGIRYSTTYTIGDTVGCGINMHTGKLFFTLNGVYQGVAFTNVSGMLFPVIGVGEREVEIDVNFGSRPFAYDLEAHNWAVEETAATLQARDSLEQSPTSTVLPDRRRDTF